MYDDTQDMIEFKSQVNITLSAVRACVNRSPDLDLEAGIFLARLREPCCVIVRRTDRARLPVRLYVNCSPNQAGRISVAVGGKTIDDSGFRAPITGLDGEADAYMVDTLFAHLIDPQMSW